MLQAGRSSYTSRLTVIPEHLCFSLSYLFYHFIIRHPVLCSQKYSAFCGFGLYGVLCQKKLKEQLTQNEKLVIIYLPNSYVVVF